MSGFFKSFLPIIKRLKKYTIEIVIISIAFFIAIISVFIYFYEKQLATDEESINISKETAFYPNKTRIFIDIAGAVEKPNVYETTSGARLKDILALAGGLSIEADQQYFSRNFNLARIVSDQEKIYIPSIIEVQNGLFIENAQTINYLQPAINQQLAINNQETNLININSATIEELDTLPGIGKVTAEKIIRNRPYQSIEELFTKKIVKKNVWEQIKNLITF